MPRVTRTNAPAPVVIYRGDIPVFERIRPGLVNDEVRRGVMVITDNPDRKLT